MLRTACAIAASRVKTVGPCVRSSLRVVLLFLFEGALMAGCSKAQTTSAKVSTAGGRAEAAILEVKEAHGLARSHWPVTAGVPFPPGVVRDASRLSMSGAGMPTALQSRVLSRWPDGSVRWVLLDWQADVPPRQTHRFQVAPGAPAAPSRAVKVTDTADGVEVDTGPLRFTVPKKRFAVLAEVRLDGKPVTNGPLVSFFDIGGKRIEAEAPASVTVTEPGPLRARIEVRGRYAATFEYVVRIDAFAGQPFVRVFHTFEQHGAEPYTLVRQIGIDAPMKLEGKASYSAGLEKGAPLTGTLRAKGVTLLQEDNETLRVGATRRSAHAAGWIDLHDATHGIAVAARAFWQEYPQSFQVRSTGLTYNLWAPEAPPAKVGMGVAKTHEMVLYFHAKTPPSAPLLAALQEPLLAQVGADWIVATGALRNSLAPTAVTKPFLRELTAGYERYRAHADRERWDDSGDVKCPDPAAKQPRVERPRRGFYGMFNWGDWNFPGYHDTTKGCDAWGNLEYDMTQVLALAYAATGERRYYDGMVAAARHFMDVDRIHYTRARPNWIGMNHPKNPLHFTFELGGVDLGHTWTEGLLSYYSFTGDDRALEAARGIADYLVNRLRTRIVKGNPRQWGWPQIALVAAYEATGDDKYKQAAAEYAHAGMAGYPPDKVAQWKLGILAEAVAYTHSITHDAKQREWLERYATAVTTREGAVDPRFLPAVAYVGRITAKPDYARAAVAAVSRLQFGGWGKPFTIAGRLGSSILAQSVSR